MVCFMADEVTEVVRNAGDAWLTEGTVSIRKDSPSAMTRQGESLFCGIYTHIYSGSYIILQI